MEAFYDKYDSVLKTVVYGSGFCRYLISRCSPAEEAIENLENATDIFYRIRSVFGVLGIYLDLPALSHEWAKLPKSSDLPSKMKQVCNLGILSSGIASNAMDFFAAILWLIPRLRDLYCRLRACLDVVNWLRPRRRVVTSALPSTMDVTSDVASSESSSRLDDVRERVEWLSNVFWASMSTLSLVSSLYAMYRAFQRARAQSVQSQPVLAHQSEAEEEEEPSVQEAGIEALESALDLVGGASGAFKLECEAEGLTGIGPTLASCIHLVHIATSEQELADSPLPAEPVPLQSCDAVPVGVDGPILPKLSLTEELVSKQEPADKVDLQESGLHEDEIDESPRRERKYSELENKKLPRVTTRVTKPLE